MAVKILDTCINCAACIDECPTEAIVDEDDMITQQEKRFTTYTKISVLSVLVTLTFQHVLKRVQLKSVSFGMSQKMV